MYRIKTSHIFFGREIKDISVILCGQRAACGLGSKDCKYISVKIVSPVE
jgi:hypothetical protein